MSSTDEATAAPAEAEDAPVTDDLREGMLATVTAVLGDAVVGSHIKPGEELWVRVTAGAWRQAAEVARDKLGCTYFSFLSTIDWLPSPFGRSEDSSFDLPSPDDAPGTPEQGYAGGETRFQVFARFERPDASAAIFFKADLDDDDPHVATIIPVYAGADWHEREAWEMYGITFDGHPNLVHLYLPGEFEGNPARKDFPLLPRLLKPWPGLVDVEPMPEEDEPAEGEDPGAADDHGESQSTEALDEGGQP